MAENYIKIDDHHLAYSSEHFSVPRHYEDSIESVIIPHGLIMDRIERLARDIYEGFHEESMTILCVLKGGFQFCQDLMQFIQALNKSQGRSIQLGLDFIRVKSYRNDESGDVTIMGSDNLALLKGKNILIVEDIVETGKTMTKLLNTLNKYEPKSVKVASLLIKRREDVATFKPDYIGFEVPNRFVIGYALDYNEFFRDLGHICIINDHGKNKYKIAPK